MKNITQLIPEKKNFRKRQGVTENQIKKSETLLNLEFSDEYKEYLSAFGAASIYGHEFTGICDTERLNVVTVTNEEKGFNPFVPQEFYVVEQLNIDGIVIWQSKEGALYQSIPNGAFEKICESLVEYIES